MEIRIPDIVHGLILLPLRILYFMRLFRTVINFHKAFWGAWIYFSMCKLIDL